MQVFENVTRDNEVVPSVIGNQVVVREVPQRRFELVVRPCRWARGEIAARDVRARIRVKHRRRITPSARPEVENVLWNDSGLVRDGPHPRAREAILEAAQETGFGKLVVGRRPAFVEEMDRRGARERIRGTYAAPTADHDRVTIISGLQVRHTLHCRSKSCAVSATNATRFQALEIDARLSLSHLASFDAALQNARVSAQAHADVCVNGETLDRTTQAELPVFLDLDGCLVDSREAIATSIDAALDEGGLTPLGRDQVDRYIGPPVIDSFREILRERGEPLECADAYVDAFRRVYKTISLEKTTLQPGIAAALDDIASYYSLFVVTSKARAFAEPIVAATGLARWIRAVFGPDLTAPEEPKTVTLARAIAFTGARSGIVVGDRRHDIEAGRNCALRTVGVTWGNGKRSELVDALADKIIERPDELPGALAELVRH